MSVKLTGSILIHVGYHKLVDSPLSVVWVKAEPGDAALFKIANLLAVGGRLGLPVELVLQSGLARQRRAELGADELHERIVARLQLFPDRRGKIRGRLRPTDGGRPPARGRCGLAQLLNIGARVVALRGALDLGG